MTDKLKALATVDYDRADAAIDKLNFTACALAGMMDTYSDSVANGLITIMIDSTGEIRRYVEAARAALVELGTERDEAGQVA